MSNAVFGANTVVDALVAAGVDTFFANPGTSEIHLVSAIDNNPKARSVLCLFEGVATGAADGFARTTGKPAAVLLHLGPGLANGLANLHNAMKARSPMVVLVGEHASGHLKYDTPLKSDLQALAGYAAKAVVSIKPGDDLAQTIQGAVELSMAHPRGPVVVVANADVMWSPVEKDQSQSTLASRRTGDDDDEGTLSATEALKFIQAGSSAMLLGGEALGAEALGLADILVQATGCSALSETFNSRQERGAGVAYVERLPYFQEAATEKLARFDRLLLVGSRPPVAFFGSPEGSSELTGGSTAVQSTAERQSPLSLLRAMCALIPSGFSPRVAEPSKSGSAIGPLTPKAVWSAVNRLMPENSIISDEAGVSSVGADDAMRGAPRHVWLNLTGGSIGQGLPAGTGAAIGMPKSQVFVFHGDGGAMYTVQSLWTQARERAKVVNVIFKNDRYAILDYEIKRHGLGPLGERGASMFSLANPSLDWIALARGMGVKALSASTAEEFSDALEHALMTDGPVLIEARMSTGKRTVKG
ncbi:acetolactate synthase large subunit [Ottowia thiooxydans]|uniref:acetolactate synthase large subunit n=1 Tax=Ottowia thiooxydans TaxID=219182 RepID=UPI0004191E45|nr:acetolactate synthase large subunit [Ottowia thiooxydans]